MSTVHLAPPNPWEDFQLGLQEDDVSLSSVMSSTRDNKSAFDLTPSSMESSEGEAVFRKTSQRAGRKIGRKYPSLCSFFLPHLTRTRAFHSRDTTMRVLQVESASGRCGSIKRAWEEVTQGASPRGWGAKLKSTHDVN